MEAKSTLNGKSKTCACFQRALECVRGSYVWFMSCFELGIFVISQNYAGVPTSRIPVSYKPCVPTYKADTVEWQTEVGAVYVSLVWRMRFKKYILDFRTWAVLVASPAVLGRGVWMMRALGVAKRPEMTRVLPRDQRKLNPMISTRQRFFDGNEFIMRKNNLWNFSK